MNSEHQDSGVCDPHKYLYKFRPVLKNNFNGKHEDFSNYKRREENQLDATECFTALINCSTCFGHLHAHHQELETILVLLPHMVCNALVAGGRLLGAEQHAMRPG